jgi:hypothetical protein
MVVNTVQIPPEGALGTVEMLYGEEGTEAAAEADIKEIRQIARAEEEGNAPVKGEAVNVDPNTGEIIDAQEYDENEEDEPEEESEDSGEYTDAPYTEEQDEPEEEQFDDPFTEAPMPEPEPEAAHAPTPKPTGKGKKESKAGTTRHDRIESIKAAFEFLGASTARQIVWMQDNYGKSNTKNFNDEELADMDERLNEIAKTGGQL